MLRELSTVRPTHLAVEAKTHDASDLIRAYNSSLPALDWMDGTTTTSALEKVRRCGWVKAY